MNRTRVGSAVFALVLLSVTTWFVWWSWPLRPGDRVDAATDNMPATTQTVASPVITLTDAKAAVADIGTQRVGRSSMSVVRTLPARFAYDERRHVAVRASTDAIIESVGVKPGDFVETGSVIAALRSPAIGEARGQVLSRKADFELAEREREWRSRICDGVRELVADIRAEQTVDVIEKNIQDRTLGQYRGQLLAAYSQSKLATELSGSASSSGGAIAGRVVLQRQSDRQQTRANLDALIEQSLFETEQACKTADADADAARRRWMVARQSLATAMGVAAGNGPGDAILEPTLSPGEADLARLEIRAPLTGTVEERFFSATERVTAGATLFIIADTSVLWVEADIRGRDWNAIDVQAGDPVAVIPSNNTDLRCRGTVHYVGRQVDAGSGAVPLVVTIDNDANQFRPGLFARVEVPTDVITDTIAVPSSAVIDLDGQPSVFVAQNDGYRPAAVEVGIASGGWIEIVGGLNVGDNVVTRGAFVLKSELLLEGEE